MRLDTFRGSTWSSVFADARRAFGDDVMIVRTQTLRGGDGSTFIEVQATSALELDGFRRRVDARGPATPGPKGAGPRVIALVGPTGAGKTTTIAKLAVHPEAFGGVRVGLISLDTYRAGALEQLQAYADIAGLPLEVVHDAADAAAARRRLGACDVILVDTPGRSPRVPSFDRAWRQVLETLAPTERHLVLPATMRLDLVDGVRETFGLVACTHLLVTKCDEVPDDAGLAELALHVDLPVRWIADGQEVPSDLHVASARVLGSLRRLGAPAVPARLPSPVGAPLGAA